MDLLNDNILNLDDKPSIENEPKGDLFDLFAPEVVKNEVNINLL